MSRTRRLLTAGAALIGTGGAVAWFAYPALLNTFNPVPEVPIDGLVPSRQEQFDKLRAGSRDNPYDVLIIGGGATGAGCAVDAASRGLRTALLEREDFGSGTSSRSTKLLHGGVRYLEKAVFSFDMGQLKLVFEALRERKTLLEIAPHLTRSLPIMTPCYKWWEVPYYWSGLKAYDLVAGVKALSWSRYVTPHESRRLFPTLAPKRSDGSSMKGTIVYYDGQFDDARMAVTLACTAALSGATTMNYANCERLIKGEDGKIEGAVVRDIVNQRECQVFAKSIINATGPFADAVRHLSMPDAENMIMPSAGVHVTLPDYYSPDDFGMIVPKTKDGRIVFMLPWLDHTIAGTTDSSSEITMRPRASEAEVQFILDAIADYLTVQVRRSDVLSAWSGIRPLAIDPDAKSTASASRDHVVVQGEDGMVTVCGGKWTTYRAMAEEAVSKAVEVGKLKPKRRCCTARLPLLGSRKYSPVTFTEVAQNYVVPHRPGAIDTRVAKHLAHSYGDRAEMVTKIAEDRKLGRRLVRGHPMLEAEVVYAVNNEYCETIVDFIARRTRLAFLDVLATKQALGKVADLLAQEKKWSSRRKRAEIEAAEKFLETFGNLEN
ncbi:unnamed protein product [Ostreobium quekettii]|uniref:Glycerol-3-phosphate dehydrogenase n=1 Tax=Ostreobium quekettii TaxID=121088 RepID=A0A8S1J4V1_9CHLO|nr:unnamed protein product [Ostreobium quekettii]|eukprot:evm.model.scf_882.9 EVM.evm.TU.scf_882.9   scf_882:50494-58405(-)